MHLIKSSLIFAAVAVFAAACSQPAVNRSNAGIVTNANTSAVLNANGTGEVTPNPQRERVEELASGKELFATNCMICHKDDGTGGKVTIKGKNLDADDLTSTKIKGFSDEKIGGYIRDGVEDEGMPAFKDKLTEAEIKTLITHVRTLQSKN